MIEKWSPIHLRAKLKELYWKDGSARGRGNGVLGGHAPLPVPAAAEAPRRAGAGHSHRRGEPDFFGTAYGQAVASTRASSSAMPEIAFDEHAAADRAGGRAMSMRERIGPM